MVDEPSLQLIQAMLQRVLDGQRRADEKMDRMLADIGDLKIRMTEIEANLAHVKPEWRSSTRGLTASRRALTASSAGWN